MTDECISTNPKKPCKKGTCTTNDDGSSACECADSEFEGEFCDAGRLQRCKIGYKLCRIDTNLSKFLTFKDQFLLIESYEILDLSN